MDADSGSSITYPEVDLTPAPLMGMGAFASTAATDPPPAVPPEERERLRAAAKKAEALYPGPVGQYLRIDLESWASSSCFRFDARGYLGLLVAELLATPLPAS